MGNARLLLSWADGQKPTFGVELDLRSEVLEDTRHRRQLSRRLRAELEGELRRQAFGGVRLVDGVRHHYL